MDDCDLEKLSAAPAKLSPKFNRNVTEYESTVPSSVEKVKFDCLTSDSGASYQIFGGNGEKTVPLKEGEVNEIRIEVSAEDGTVKKYFVRIKRLSASDASLTQLSLSVGKLDPAFAMGCDEYTCAVPCSTEQITVKPKAPDTKCLVVVNGSNSDFVVPLLMGQTKVVVKVSSVDGSRTMDYVVTVYRKQLPWPVNCKDPTTAMKYECPMTLSLIYNPISIAGSDPKVCMSQPCLDMLTRRSKVNPMSDIALDNDWRKEDSELDKQISNSKTLSVFSYKGVKDELLYSKMAGHVQNCEGKPSADVDPKKVTDTPWYKAEFETSTAKAPEVKHKVEVRNWEKRLQHMVAGQENADELMKEIDQKVKSYKFKLPKQPGETARFSEGESPVDDLHQIAVCAAAAAKAKSKDSKYHLKFALALEEQHHLEELYGFSKKDENSTEAGAGTNIEAQQSSKLEECQAICRLRGVTPNAPIALQLKAIDEEYQSLRDSGQSGRADHVQSLYAWRSKEALKGEQSGRKKLDENDPLSQAYLKYMDALVLDPNNHLCNFHASRMLIERGEHEEAIKRLQQAAGLKPVSVEARFLLGMSICLQTSGPGDRFDEAVTFLHEGLEHLLMRRHKEADTEGHNPSCLTDFHGEDYFRLSNLQLFQGLIILAENLKKKPQPNFKSAKDIYHCVCLHASMALCALYHRGNLFQQIEWILLDAHYALLSIMMKERATDTEWIAQRCRYLSAMIRSATIPRNKKLLALQEKVSQSLASINPCDSVSLYLLGLSQLMIFDSELNPAVQTPLLEARSSLEASISLEEKPVSGEVPEQIASQNWWKEKIAAEKAKAQASQPQSAPSKPQPTGPAARGRGAAPVRGRGRAAVAAPARGSRGAAKAAPPPARGRGAAVARGSKTNVAAPVKCDKSKESVKVEESKPAASNSNPAVTASGKPAPINKTSYLTRLALARAYSRTEDKKSDARQRYEEVIKMAPEVHDSYIELAELLIKSDPLAAVDIYCRFPSNKNGDEDSFDDAYLSGEIVSILMKHEKFDDVRLVEHMIKWGRVMGIGVLEKHMGILDAKFKTEMLKNIYAGVHRKDVNDPDLAAFFKFKCWI